MSSELHLLFFEILPLASSRTKEQFTWNRQKEKWNTLGCSKNIYESGKKDKEQLEKPILMCW